MMTRKLHQAYKVTSLLVAFLEKREWENSYELTSILETADDEIDKISNKAINDVIAKLESSYLEEAKLWASNEQSNILGEPIKISKVEQRSAQTEMRKIQKTINELKALMS